ncbi:MAG: glycosyltransferase [Spirosomataceae bacterium]
MKTAIVIPCYNEANRLNFNAFRSFLAIHANYHLCFVNDGSKDDTLVQLHRMRKGFERQLSIVNCEKNGGKAEAVRQGVLQMYNTKSVDYIGFLDADLSVSLEEFTDLVQTLHSDQSLKIVSGSRVKRMGAVINRNLKRHLIGRSIATLISLLLGLPFYDTQCGAKVFRKDLVPVGFRHAFQSAWLFDVELFMRMKKYFGLQAVMNLIFEYPLRRWVHVEDSKIGASDLVKIPLQLLKIQYHYQIKPRFTFQWPTLSIPQFVSRF